MMSCPICDGTFTANRQYMGFDAVLITEWVCDGCGRVVKIGSKVSGSEARKAPDAEEAEG